MLIIEGADHLGKTTAAKRLVELAASHKRYPIRYTHMSRPNESFDFCGDYQDISSKFAVQDRFHLGGLVWHERKFTRDSLKIVEGRLQALGSVCIVFYTSDVKWYRQALDLTGKPEMFSNDRIIAANDEFKRLVDYVAWSDFVYDIKDGRFPDDTVLLGWLNSWYRRLELIGEKPRTFRYPPPDVVWGVK